MRYLIFILILAACTVPPNVQKTEAAPVAVELPAPIEVHSPKEPAPKEKPRPAKTRAPNAPQCAGIDTGDVKESINLKLDCLLDAK